MSLQAYCITLNETPDRKNKAQTQLEKLPSDINWDFHYENKDPEGHGSRGCYNSHVNVMRKSLALGLPYVIVFEDDCHISKWDYDAWQEVKRFLATEEFDTLKLGFCGVCFDIETTLTNFLQNKPIEGYKKIFYAAFCACTHAVIYSRSMMEKFVREYPEYTGVNIDLLPNTITRNYIVLPMMVFQNPEIKSTISIDDITSRAVAMGNGANLQKDVWEPFSVRPYLIMILSILCIVTSLIMSGKILRI
jgi:hypothetical protein